MNELAYCWPTVGRRTQLQFRADTYLISSARLHQANNFGAKLGNLTLFVALILRAKKNLKLCSIYSFKEGILIPGSNWTNVTKKIIKKLFIFLPIDSITQICIANQDYTKIIIYIQTKSCSTYIKIQLSALENCVRLDQ